MACLNCGPVIFPHGTLPSTRPACVHPTRTNSSQAVIQQHACFSAVHGNLDFHRLGFNHHVALSPIDIRTSYPAFGSHRIRKFRCRSSGSTASVTDDPARVSDREGPSEAGGPGPASSPGDTDGSQPNYVPLNNKSASSKTGGPQLSGKPLLMRPTPPPMPPPMPPLKPPTAPSPAVFGGGSSGRAKSWQPNGAAGEGKPKFEFKPREQRQKVHGGGSTGGGNATASGAALSLREILEKAERMGNARDSGPAPVWTAKGQKRSLLPVTPTDNAGEESVTVFSFGDDEDETPEPQPVEAPHPPGASGAALSVEPLLPAEAEAVPDDKDLPPVTPAPTEGVPPVSQPELEPTEARIPAPPQSPMFARPSAAPASSKPTPPVRSPDLRPTPPKPLSESVSPRPVFTPRVTPPQSIRPPLLTPSPPAPASPAAPRVPSPAQVSIPEVAESAPEPLPAVSAPEEAAPEITPPVSPVAETAPAVVPTVAPRTLSADLIAELQKEVEAKSAQPPQSLTRPDFPARPVLKLRPQPMSSFRTPAPGSFRPKPLDIATARSAEESEEEQEEAEEAEEAEEVAAESSSLKMSPPPTTPSLATLTARPAPPPDRRPMQLSAPPLMRPKPLPVPEPPQIREKPIWKARESAVAPPAEPAVRKGPILKDTGRKTDGGADVREKKPKVAGAPLLAKKPVDATAARPGGGPKGRDGWKSKEQDGEGRGPKGKKGVGGKSEVPFDAARKAGSRRANKFTRKAARAEAAAAAAPVKVEILEVGTGGMAVEELATQLAVNDSDVVRCLFMKGIAVAVNQVLDEAMVRMVCREYEVEVVEAGSVRVEDLAVRTREFLDEEDLEHLVVRPPVVTIMGHVDHGKTSLLDYIRKSKVAAGEAGGITQGIGAYRVAVPVGESEQSCVFLDTPGHEAFSAMRARGARVTDIAIIVVAADDGVRPQTVEAIAHARAAKVPLIVAINKCDKEGANPDRVMQELAGEPCQLLPAAWGGETEMMKVSALTGEGIDELLEMVMLQSEVLELQANPSRPAVGTVIEASLDKSRGPVATLLVQNGTLKRGDVVLCGEAYGKVRALVDDRGQRSEDAGPSMAAEILGLNGVPVAGDEFEVVGSLDEARSRATLKAEQLRGMRLALQAGEGKVTLASLTAGAQEGQVSGALERHVVNLVVKVDAQGSVEAIKEALRGLPQDTVALRYLLAGPGDISSSDVDLAVASQAVVLGFNVNCSSAVESLAEDKGVELRNYKVIYDLVDDMRKAMEGLLDTVEERVPLGQAEVRAVFGTGSNRVAGCMVTEGKLVKNCHVSVSRGGKEVHTGKLSSLRRVKELAKEVAAGLECGVGVGGFDTWADGDVIQAYSLVIKERTLEDASVTTASSYAAKETELDAIDGLAQATMVTRQARGSR